MATPVLTALTRGQIEAELIRRSGQLVGYVTEGTNSGTAANTLIDVLVGASGLAQFASADIGLVNKRVFIYQGTAAGDFAIISSFTAASGGGTIVPVPAFSAPLSSTSKYIIYSPTVFQPPTLTRAVLNAFAQLTFDKETMTGVMLNVAEGREIMIGNALLNPLGDLTTTANTPDSWTISNMAVTQRQDITYGGARNCIRVVTNGAVVADYKQSLTEIGRWKGQNVPIWAWVYCVTAGEVFLQCYDGVTTTTSALHGGTGWEYLLISPNIGANASEITISLKTTTAASAITFHPQVVWFPKSPSDEHVYALDADIGLIALNPTLLISDRFGVNGGGVGNFKHRLDADDWDIVRESTRKIRLHTNHDYNGCVIEYSGWKAHTELTLVSTVFNATLGQVDALLELAMEMLFVGVVGQPAAGDVAGMRASLLKQFGTKIPMDAKIVELI